MGDVRINFTKASLDALPLPPPGKRATYHDTKVRGLVVRVTGTGAKTFVVYRRVDGKPTRITVGSYPDLSIEQARRKAEEHNGAIALGENPNNKKRAARAELTLGELFDRYVALKSRKKSLAYDEAQFRRYLAAWAGRRVSDIQRADVRQRHAEVGAKHGPYSANRMLALLRGLYNVGRREEIITAPNPAEGIAPFPEHERERRLQGHELPAFFEALAREPNETIRDYVLMSLLTGARKSNVLAMRWEQIDFTTEVWRIPETKNGTAQSVPLVKNAIALLKERKSRATGPWVFPGDGRSGHLMEPKTGWARILANSGLRDVRLHDLRRTLGSYQIDQGSSLAVIGRTLNHKSPAATLIYARLALDPVRQSMESAVEAMWSAGGLTPAPAEQAADADA